MLWKQLVRTLPAEDIRRSIGCANPPVNLTAQETTSQSSQNSRNHHSEPHIPETTSEPHIPETASHLSSEPETVNAGHQTSNPPNPGKLYFKLH